MFLANSRDATLSLIKDPGDKSDSIELNPHFLAPAAAPLPDIDAEALDSYSRTVMNALKTVSPAVVYIKVKTKTAQSNSGRRDGGGDNERGGSGSGFLFTPGRLYFHQQSCRARCR